MMDAFSAQGRAFLALSETMLKKYHCVFSIGACVFGKGVCVFSIQKMSKIIT